jgi:hypothetical protein
MDAGEEENGHATVDVKLMQVFVHKHGEWGCGQKCVCGSQFREVNKHKGFQKMRQTETEVREMRYPMCLSSDKVLYLLTRIHKESTGR